MQLSWFSPAPQRRRRGKHSRRRASATLGVRQLERRRVLDATIATMPAVVDPAQPLVVDEGTSVTASVTTDGPEPFIFEWTLTQGPTTLQSGTDPTFNFVAPDDGNYQINVSIKDVAGQLLTDTQDVVVNNVAPQLTDPADFSILENGTATLVTTIEDPGALDVFSVDVNWQDGTADTIAGLGLTDVMGTVGGTTYEWTASSRQLTLSHKYLDDGPSPGNNTTQDDYAVTLTAMDDDLGVSAQQTTVVTVENVAPQLAVPADVTITENDISTLTTTITDPGTLDVFSVDVDWQDGTADTITGLGLTDVIGTIGGTDYEWTAATRQLKLSHKYLDDGPSPGNNTGQDEYAVTLVARDDDVRFGVQQIAIVTVKNEAPQLVDPADVTISENGTATLTTTVNDPGTLDVFSVDVNWQDGTSDTINGLGLVDAAGTVGSTSFEWTTSTRQLKLSHKYLDDGPSPGNNTAEDDFAVTLLVHDDDAGTSNQQTAIVTVQNVAPQLVDPADVTISENGTATLITTINDPGTLDVFSVDVNWQDGTTDTITGLGLVDVSAASGATSYEWIAATRQLKLSHRYLDDGPSPGNNTAQDDYGVTLVAKDDDLGASDVQTAIVTVENVAPAIALNTVAMINENGSATLAGSYTDIGILDGHTVIIDWDDPNDAANSTFAIPAIKDVSGTLTLAVGNTFSSSSDEAVLTITSVNETTGEAGFSVQHQYLDDGLAPGNNSASDTSTIVVAVADDDFGSAVDNETVLVKNVPPDVSLGTVAMINENGTATLSGSYTDIGLLDGHTVTIDWDDPNDTANSTFAIPALRDAAGMATLAVGNKFNSSTDEAVLTITSVNATTGKVGFSVQHQYLDDGLAPGNNTADDTSTIAVTVADDDTGVGTDSETVLVKNVPPVVSLNTVALINENGSATLAGSYTDIGLLDGHTVTIDWDDANDSANSTFAIPSIRNAAGVATLAVGNTFNSSTDEAVLTITSVNETTGEVGFSVQHQYLDDGLAPGNNTADDTSTIVVAVFDDDLGSAIGNETVLVKNVAPAVNLNTVAMINENGSATLAGSYTDIGLLDGHTVTIDWDDPNDAADSTFTIPAIRDAAGAATLNVGDTFNSSTDEAVLTITSINATTGEVGFSIQHQYLDDGLAPGNNTADDTSTIVVTVADDDTGVGVDSETVLVKNVAPTLSVVANQTRNEGQLLDLSSASGAPNLGSFSDPGTLDLHKAQIDWGDGHVEVGTVIQSAGSGLIVGSHTYADDGVYTVIVRLADDDMSAFLTPGNFNAGTNGVDFVEMTFTVTVSNVTPALTDVGSPNVVDEGQAFVLSNLGDATPNLGIGLSDPGFDNPLNPTMPPIGNPFAETFTGFTIDWGDGTADTPLTVVMRTSGSPSTPTTALFQHAAHTYADNGVYTVRVRVADDNMTGNFTSGTNGVDFVDLTFTITVNNVAPTLAPPAPSAATINENGSVSFNVTFTDPGFDNPANDDTPPNGGEAAETFNYDIDWGDGRQAVADVAVDATPGAVGVPSAGSFGGTHIFADDGTYTVTVTIHDDDGGVHSQQFTVVVLNTPPLFVPNADGESFEGTDISSLGLSTITVSYRDAGFDNTANPNPSVLPNISDPQHESFTHLLNWGDGTIDAIHTYADAGTYTVTVTVAGPDLNGTFEIPGFDGNGQSVLTLVSGQLLNVPGAVPYTYQISWGDGAAQTVTLMLNQPGNPQASNGLTTVFSSLRTSGGEGVDTTGSFEVQHRYLGPPNPNNPTADIQITATVLDDNNSSVSDFIFVPNPGINVINVAIDTTPDIGRLDFVPPAMADVFLGQIGASTQSLQTQEVGVARSEQNLTTDLYLELVIVYPDGRKSEGYRLKEEALQDLRALFATLPDNLYQIFLVRTENNSRRLVMEVYVRQGRVVDPTDDSEGTRDRPPTSEQAPAAMPLEQNPLLEQAPDQGQIDAPQPVGEHSAGDAGSSTDATKPDDTAGTDFPSLQPPASSPKFGRTLRWSAPLVGLGLAAGGWSGRVDAALQTADDRAWQRLRRAGRLGRIIRPANTDHPRQNTAQRD